MSQKKNNNNNNGLERKTPPLIQYLKEDIPIEDIRDVSSPRRIASIDFVKGFAILFIIACHAGAVWLDKDWVYIYGMTFAVLDILGPSLFVFLSALSVIFSVRNKQGKLPEKVIKARIYSRGITIMVIGVLFNLISIEATIGDVEFPLSLWGWNILMFIGVSQIVSYHVLKLGQLTRAVIGTAIIFISPLIREFLYLNKDTNPLIWILHYIITSPAPSITFLPWVAVCFISTIFGEFLYEAMNDGSEEAYYRLYKIFMFWGITLVVIGVAFGLELQTPQTMAVEEYWQLDLLRVVNQQDYYQFPGMPLFLIRGTSSAMIYQIGAALLIMGISFYLIDIKGKRNMFISMTSYYGKTSLSLFLIHFVFLTLYIGTFNIIFFPFIALSYMGFLGFLMYMWMEYGNGTGSPEWIMIQIGRVGQKTGEKTKEGIKKVEEGLKKTAEKTKEVLKKKEARG